MAVDILAFFSKKGIPEEWLTPKISIKNIDGTVLVTAEDMTDVTSWFYSYEFTWDDDWESYIVISDGIDIKLDSRYNRYAWVLSSSGLTTIIPAVYAVALCFNVTDTVSVIFDTKLFTIFFG